MIPDYHTAVLPTLRALSGGAVRSAAEIRDDLRKVFKLSDDETRELVPSGQKTVFSDRVSWALTYMKKAGLVETPKRAHYRISQRGRDLLASNPQRIDLTVLVQFPEFVEWKERSDAPKGVKAPQRAGSDTPQTAEESV